MPRLHARLRFARLFLLLLGLSATVGCAVARLARWPLLLLAVVGALGCGTFRDHEACEDDYDDYQAAGYRRGGSVSPGHLNARPGYSNG
jgi:hypothetical protein